MLPALALMTCSLLSQAEVTLPSVTTLHVENDILAKSDRCWTGW